ncbi:hypothetical protein PsYK624_003280 [Phanerochaete sordida]|uniref:Uncharacterized protein n=1 Tax=Phanerochaete sordida TaxID=48140 RepID=A0A9P3L826_9APHY|nr:hypothetical protein PsYK624_003280 [Phanerochaete sordida]
MDDDLDIGASVWGASERLSVSLAPPSFSEPSPAPSSSTDGFDDFDDFGTPAETIAASDEGADDDFGDFGDFGEVASAADVPAFEDNSFQESTLTPRPASGWQPLQVDPTSSRDDIQQQIDSVLAPLWTGDNPSFFSEEPIRQSEGLSQVLVTRESRQLYDLLLPATQPTFKPVNWTRSRIRRQHLITLGIPVNLDEVLPKAGPKLPTLEIHTRPMSAPPAHYSAPIPRPAGPASRVGTPRSGTPQPGVRSTALAAAQTRLGPQPELDETKIEELLAIDTDNLLLVPTDRLNKYVADFKEQTAHTSALLTYLLQTRDALQQDSETYNKVIGELVGEAQKIKTGKRTGTGPLRRGSGMV